MQARYRGLAARRKFLKNRDRARAAEAKISDLESRLTGGTDLPGGLLGEVDELLKQTIPDKRLLRRITEFKKQVEEEQIRRLLISLRTTLEQFGTEVSNRTKITVNIEKLGKDLQDFANKVKDNEIFKKDAFNMLLKYKRLVELMRLQKKLINYPGGRGDYQTFLTKLIEELNNISGPNPDANLQPLIDGLRKQLTAAVEQKKKEKQEAIGQIEEAKKEQTKVIKTFGKQKDELLRKINTFQGFPQPPLFLQIIDTTRRLYRSIELYNSVSKKILSASESLTDNEKQKVKTYGINLEGSKDFENIVNQFVKKMTDIFSSFKNKGVDFKFRKAFTISPEPIQELLLEFQQYISDKQPSLFSRGQGIGSSRQTSNLIVQEA
tara:strand:+ start:249 stop:1385 length:1137 start_codon:yes stop_codon:yes gene_type:complete